MKLIDRHEFLNGKAFETYFLEAADVRRYDVPECDVIGLRRVGEEDRMTIMRPDEALIQARLLIDAVYQVSEGYQVNQPRADESETKPISMELVEDLEAADDDETKSAEAFAERAWSGNE